MGEKGTFKSPVRVKNILNRFIPRVWDRSTGLHKYGTDNLFPQEIIKMISQSSPALKGVRKLSQFTFGGGFSDKELAKMIVKPGDEPKTMNQLFAELCDQMSWFQGAALYIMRDKFGKIQWVDSIRFEFLRKDDNGDFIFNEFLGTDRWKKSDDKRFPAFTKLAKTPLEMVKHVKKYGNVGEILYLYKRDAISIHYPFPDYFAAEFDIKTSIEMSAMDYENSINSWMTSALITLVGDIDDEEEDDNNKTELDYHVEELSKLTGAEKDSVTGLSGRNKFAVMTAPDKDSIPNVQTFDIEKFIDSTTAKKESNARDVLRAFDIHPVLAGYSEPTVLGNDKAMANAVNEVNNAVEWRKQLLVEGLQKIWPDKDLSIEKFIPFQYIPDKVMEKMTDEEIRNLADLPPVETRTPSATEAVINTLNTMSPLVANEILNRMSDKQVLDLVGLLPDPDRLNDPKRTDTNPTP